MSVRVVTDVYGQGVTATYGTAADWQDLSYYVSGEALERSLSEIRDEIKGLRADIRNIQERVLTVENDM